MTLTPGGTMTRLALSAVAAALLLAGCGGEPQPVPTVTVEATVTTTARATVTATATVTLTATPAPVDAATGAVLSLATDEELCAADAELTNLELNDALAPILGFPADRDLRTFEQDEAIREYKNAAFARACPARAS